MLFSYYLCCQTSMSAMLHLESVMPMPTVRILLGHISARAKLDTVEMAKHAEVLYGIFNLTLRMQQHIFKSVCWKYDKI